MAWPFGREGRLTPSGGGVHPWTRDRPLGAASIDVTPLKGRQMLNLDSEAEGIFTVSCAGGNTSACLLPLTPRPL